MNIMFFLTPKRDVSFVYEDNTLRQTLERMERGRFSAVPVIKRTGEYVGSVTEGDLLWYLKNHSDLNLSHAEEILLSDIPRRDNKSPVSATAEIDDLCEKAMTQNFVPVVDGRGIFIGIITRREIIKYLYDQHLERAEEGRQATAADLARVLLTR